MILFYIMKFFFYNNLSDSEIIKNTFVNHCSILKIENDSSVMSAKTLIGKTVHFREKNMSKIIQAIYNNSSKLNRDKINRFYVSSINTKKNNGVYTILPYTNN